MAMAEDEGPYDRIMYVGRLVPSKKVDVLVRAFALTELRQTGATLTLVGEGSARATLEALVEAHGLAKSVDFLGHVDKVSELRDLYRSALASVSPGYVGLSLTQSCGFGVPMVISRDEPHSPELELQRFGGVTYFETDSCFSLAKILDGFPRAAQSDARERLRLSVRGSYSAEAMAAGLVAALRNENQNLGGDGWPKK
jgi:glycosyltransferase involved in cell wall biosynthesis